MEYLRYWEWYRTANELYDFGISEYKHLEFILTVFAPAHDTSQKFNRAILDHRRNEDNNCVSVVASNRYA